MANIFTLFSTLAIAGVTIPMALGKSKKSKAVAEAPASHMPKLLQPLPGWTLIECDDVESFRNWLKQDEQGLPPLDGEELSLGSHVLVEMYGCDKSSLEATRSVGTAMIEAARESKATIVTDSFHEFEPYGVSGAVIIQESHYTIHTWPEHGYAAVDLFYCGGKIDVHRALDTLTERFQPERLKFLVVRRGLMSEVRH